MIGTSGKVTFESPSNIALVKYWGKYGRQMPRNASLSFTLQNAKSITTCEYEVLDKQQEHIQLTFSFEGEENNAFANKISKFFLSIEDIFPWIRQIKFNISSENTFPHSTGIASSASAMSALSLCLCTIHEKVSGRLDDYLQHASMVSRLGSGSASRSVYPHLALWGAHPNIPGTSNEFAVPFGDEVDDIFKGFHDDILIVSKTEKSVSSTAGHALMDSNPYAESRYQSANENLSLLIKSMKDADLETFIDIVEREALTLHAQMMCSKPSYILMEPNTLEMIIRIQRYRNETKIPVCFTLDAGPNIHLLYPAQYASKIDGFIDNQLLELTQDDSLIRDRVGLGPKKTNG